MGSHRLLSQYGAMYAVLMLLLLAESSATKFLSTLILVVPLIQTASQLPYQFNHEPEIKLAVTLPAGDSFYSKAADKLSAFLNSSDIVSAEALGYLSYRLIDTKIHDPFGLTNQHIARKGDPHAPFGKMDIQYTIRKVKPSVMLWHYAGHLKGDDPDYLDKNYVTYCFSNCNSWNANVAMIRRDRANELATNFIDWKSITISSLIKQLPQT